MKKCNLESLADENGIPVYAYKIFLDRYAQKTRDWHIGNLCLAKLFEDEGDHSKYLCEIIGYGDNSDVEYLVLSSLDTQVEGEFNIRTDKVDILKEIHMSQMWHRVSSFLADKSDEAKSYYDMLNGNLFVPGGRILEAAGSGTDHTMYNCYVLPSPDDSKDGIFQTCLDMAKIMSVGGGVGINISSLRPRYAYTRNTNGRSSGAVSWGEIYSFVTGLIEQGGSRRGALMLILNDWHPDLLEFIDFKRDMAHMTNANISIGISHEFMEAVKNDLQWSFQFPDYEADSDIYDKHWNGNLESWAESGYPIKVYDAMPAREIWDKIINSAWASAEPGLFFMDRSNDFSNSGRNLVSTNPCVTGDTRIAVSYDGKSITSSSIKELADNGNDILVLAYDEDNMRTVLKMGRNPRKTGTKSIFRIHFYDTDFVIDCTEDHEFLCISEYHTLDYMKTTDLDGQHLIYHDTGYLTCEYVEELDVINDVYNITVDDLHNYVIVDAKDDYSCISHNCGEQPLPDWGVCLLGALNLPEFIDEHTGRIIWKLLEDACRKSVRMMNKVIDKTPYVSEENKERQLGERRVGIGTMGLAELFVKMHVRYGSQESISIIDEIYSRIMCWIYEESIDLAREDGPYPYFNFDEYSNSEFFKNLPDYLKERIKEYGIRNVTLMTQAPTGSTGTMMGRGYSGIEPFYAWKYQRNSRIGIMEQTVPIYEEMKAVGLHETDFMVTSMEISPEEHVRVQAAIQKYTDSAISKTANCPEDWTPEQVGELYMLMYDLGCKGGTIYRDNSRSVQVLEIEKEQVEETKIVHKKTRPSELHGSTYKRQTPVGNMYVTVNSDENGNPFEVFVNIGKAGSDISADAEALGRLISLILRMPSDMGQETRLYEIFEELSDIGGRNSIGFGNDRVVSMPDAVSKVLRDILFSNQIQEIAERIPYVEDNGNHASGDLCPGCGSYTLIRQEGCSKCMDCGYSKC